ncbi:flagellar protein FlaG [Paenibacillus kobensis]|uniref:flagellar protein FlaG n=1 Tax=Paenibacillus kobensis TaxID=59841 RepID=UPI000FD7C921|nr:flagellar protein FlaG [Paenibacillus kobensis]
MEISSLGSLAGVGLTGVQPEAQKAEVLRVAGAFFELKDRQKYDVLSVSEKALLEAIEKANKTAQGTDTEFVYKHHKDSSQIIVQILNKETQELIVEIPSEKMMALVEKLQQLTVGALIDEKR